MLIRNSFRLPLAWHASPWEGCLELFHQFSQESVVVLPLVIFQDKEIALGHWELRPGPLGLGLLLLRRHPANRDL